MTTIFVSSGVTSSGLTVSNTETVDVLSGGELIGSTILAGGIVVLSSGASASGLVTHGGVAVISGLDEGAQLFIDAGATATGTVLNDFISNEEVYGVASGTVVSPGTQLDVDSGGVSSNAVVSSGGYEFLRSGGVMSGDAILGGGYLDIEWVASNQSLTIATGHAASAYTLDGATIARGAYVDVFVCAVDSGGTLSLLAGAIGTQLTVFSGGTLDGSGSIWSTNYDYGSVTGVVVGISGNGPGTFLEVESGGSASSVVVADGATLKIDSGGKASSTIISSGSTLVVRGSGLANNTIVSSGGAETISSGGSESGTTIQPGGYESLHGVASGTVVSAGGIDSIDLTGSALAPQVRGLLLVAGGKVSGAQVLGGEIQVGPSGIDSGTVVSGGIEMVMASGTAIGTTVETGAQVVSGATAKRPEGGLAIGTTVVSGRERVEAGGTVSGLSVGAAGQLIDNGRVLISGAGSLLGTLSGSGNIVETGAGDLVLGAAGAAFSGQAVISGGTVELSGAHAIGTGRVVFAGGATSQTLQIDAADAPAAGGTFANVISNFSDAHDAVDLRSIAFAAGASASLSGKTLTLTDGGHSYRFTLGGSMAGTYVVTSDGHGGTLIEPPVAGFAQALAGFSARGAAITAPVTAGGTSGFAALLHATASAGGRA